MGQGPVIYETAQALGPCTEVIMRWVGGAVTLARGAVIRHVPQATFAAFTSGIALDADVFGASPDNYQFAGILSDDSVGAVVNGDRITVIRPHAGTVVWTLASGVNTLGHGVLFQDGSGGGTAQGFATSGAYAAGDIAVALMPADAADNPFLADNLAPLKFTYGLDPANT